MPHETGPKTLWRVPGATTRWALPDTRPRVGVMICSQSTPAEHANLRDIRSDDSRLVQPTEALRQISQVPGFSLKPGLSGREDTNDMNEPAS